MTENDPRDPAEDAIDELASAYLDGELSDTDAARVEADPQLRQRADELGAARDLLASGATDIEPPQWDAIVGAARREVGSADTASDATPAPVVDLGSRRSKVPWVIGVAAAAILVVALAAAVFGRSGGPRGASKPGEEVAVPTSVPVSTTTSEPFGGIGATGATGSTSARQAEDEFRAAFSVTGLGSFDQLAALASVAAPAADRQHQQPPAAGASAADIEAVGRCVASVRRDDRRLGALRYAAKASYQGQPVLVLVFQDFGVGQGSEPRRLVVVGQDTCAVAGTTKL